MPGVLVEVTEDCTSCKVCVDGTCFVDAIIIKNGRAEITAECLGCGRCVEVCPEDAIVLSIEGEKNIQETINRLSKVVDLK
jgi:flavoprotein